eukprot:TRINITY_DN11121_c1_g6_i1.p1 TRINITY_DN11121_c1_g6~~TRINITY_DN11121_c1_g6_i1.p1  ORF type:complete len:957 (+),score=98.88 TRINITY_DN11121_c1_g6_i1:347-2872(+)
MLDFQEFIAAFCSTPEYRGANLETIIESYSRTSRAYLEDARRSPTDKAHSTGATLAALRTYVDTEIAVMSSLMQLPATTLMIVCFILAVLYHQRISLLQASDHSINFDVVENANFAFSGKLPFENGRMGHKNVYDVNCIADFWSWFGLGLVPLFWYEGWDLSEMGTNVAMACMSPQESLRAFGWTGSLSSATLLGSQFEAACPELLKDVPGAPPDWFGTPGSPSYLYYRAVVGGLRLSQERSDAIPCLERSDSYRPGLHSGACVSEYSTWLFPNNARQALYMKPELVNKVGGETIYLLSGQSQQEIRRELKSLEDKVWWSPYTTKVQLTFTTFNPHLDAFTATYIIFFPNRAGHILKQVHSQTMWLHPYHTWECYVVDIIWLLAVLKIFLEEGKEISVGIRKNGLSKGLRSYLGVDNAVDWLNITFSFIIVFLWMRYLTLIEELTGMLAEGTAGVPGTWADDATRAKFYEHVDIMTNFHEDFTLYLAAYPFLMITRLFKAFSAQPRLALVTNTLVKASVDLFHFGFVFLSVFLLFTASAIILFGHYMEEFATFARAADTCFHILLGDIDWERMREAGRVPAGIWFWMFMWMVEIVMFNMLLAIVTDVYTEVRGGIGGNASTMWTQAYDLVRREWERRQGRRVSLHHVAHHLEGCSMEPDELITIKGLMDLVPKISEKQATRLVTNAVILDDSAADDHTSQSLSQAVVAIRDMHNQMRVLQESVENNIHISELGVDLLKREIRKLDDATVGQSPAFSMPAQSTGMGMGPEAPAWLERCLQKYTDSLHGRMDELTIHIQKLERSQHLQQQCLQQLLTGSPAAQSSTAGLCSIGQRSPPQAFFP